MIYTAINEITEATSFRFYCQSNCCELKLIVISNALQLFIIIILFQCIELISINISLQFHKLIALLTTNLQQF